MKADPPAGSSASNASATTNAGARTQCVYGGTLVPCEIAPTTLLDTLEKKAALGDKYDAELRRHNTTLDLLDACETKAIEQATLARQFKAERDLARDELRGDLPTWARVTAIVIVALASGGTGVWLGSKL